VSRSYAPFLFLRSLSREPESSILGGTVHPATRLIVWPVHSPRIEVRGFFEGTPLPARGSHTYLPVPNDSANALPTCEWGQRLTVGDYVPQCVSAAGTVPVITPHDRKLAIVFAPWGITKLAHGRMRGQNSILTYRSRVLSSLRRFSFSLGAYFSRQRTISRYLPRIRRFVNPERSRSG